MILFSNKNKQLSMSQQMLFLPINHTKHHKQKDKQQSRSYSNQDIKQYFNSKIQSTHSRKVLQSVQRIDTKINQQIEEGEISIPIQSENISHVLLQQRINKQQRKAMKLKLKRQQINITLQYLDMQIRGANASEFNIGRSSNSILTKKEHEELMIKLRKERFQTQQRRLKLQQSLEKQRQQKQQYQKKLHEIAVQNDKQYRRKKIEERSKQHKEDQLKKSIQKEQQKKFFEEMKHKKCLFQQMEDKYKSQVIIPGLEEKKKKLKEIREMKAFNIEQINTHQQQYLKKKQQSAVNFSRIDATWHYKPPKKSKKLLQLVENQQIRMKKKLLQKKRIIQDNIAKQEIFVQYLKQKFPPKVSERKKEQLAKRISSLQTQRRQPSNYKQIGNAYLQQFRSNKSRNTQNSQHLPVESNSMVLKKKYEIKTQNSENQSNKRSYTNYLKKPTNRNYTELRRKRLQKLIESNPEDSNEKIDVLKIQYKKLNQQAKRKQELLKVCKDEKVQQQAIDLLLDSIKAKMSLMQIYNKGQ